MVNSNNDGESPQMLIWFDRLVTGLGDFVLLCALSCLSVKSKAPHLENKTTKDILSGHLENGGKVLWSEDGGLV